MVIEGSSPARVAGRTDEVRALLVGYAGVLEAIDGPPSVSWAGLERPRILRWLRFPAPRALVSILLVRHVSRCVSALKRGGARRGALADVPGPLHDLKMLERFEKSLPTGARLAVIAPLALVGILFVAFILTHFVIKSVYSELLGDLTTAAFELDRRAALVAFEKDRGGPLMYLGVTAIIAWSATLVIAPLLPAFSVKRRLLRPLAGLEARGFAALGCRRLQDLELDLVAQLLVITPAAIVGALVLWVEVLGSPAERAMAAQDPATTLLGVVAVLLVGPAGVELHRRYAVRRTDTARRHARITRYALWLLCVLGVAEFIMLVIAADTSCSCNTS
jgi:hypothetical protein